MKIIDKIKAWSKKIYAKLDAWMVKTFKLMINFGRLHGVKLIVLALTAAIFIWDMVSGQRNGSILLFLLIAFQVRGIIWENKYIKRIQELMGDKK